MKSETMELHKKKAPIKVSCGVITLSDRFSNDKEGEDKDLSGKYLKEELGKKYDVDAYAIIPDEMDTLRNTIEEMIDNGIEVIITTGGTGLESRDITAGRRCRARIISKQPFGIRLGGGSLSGKSDSLTGSTRMTWDLPGRCIRKRDSGSCP